MGWMADQADAAAEKAAYETGGYCGLFKYKCFKAYQCVKKTCCCCC